MSTSHRIVVTLCRNIGVILCAVCMCADADTRSVHEVNQVIQETLKRGDCYKAGALIQEATNRDNDDSRIPDWYYGLSQCSKGDPSGFGLVIREYFDRRIKQIATRQSCNGAEKFVRTIDTKYRFSGNYPSWLFSVARCYEKAGAQDRALPIYMEIAQDYKDADLVVKARFRINWFTGDRSWIFATAQPLLKGVIAAIKRRDTSALNRFASKSNFYWGYFEQTKPMFFDEKPQAELGLALKRSTSLEVGEPIYKSPKEIFLLVTLPEEKFPLWHFWFWDEEGGWQWTGISVSRQGLE